MIAKTEAAGGASLDPQILAFTSSLGLDRALLKEDLIGSLAHLTMLARRKIIPVAAAKSIKEELTRIWALEASGQLTLSDEEDVHMAIEAQLAAKLGETAGLLHSARSRNDQVALDLRLHVRDQCAKILQSLAELLKYLAKRAEDDFDILMPSYTHRQRAQPISAAFFFCGYAAMFARDAEAVRFALEQVDAMPLGVGAIAGTTLDTDREIPRSLLKFSKLTSNGLDTVGDRDFALDYLYACARCLVHASRLATDMIDFSSAEFGYVQLAGEIACGSSMMPQKRNPDVFELIRGKSGRAFGNLTGLFVTLKGLPGGYNRDLQEDRSALLETGPLWQAILSTLLFSLPRVSFNRDRCLAALDGDYTQATDLAEALVKKGIPFRHAYKAVGALVRKCQDEKLPLSKVTLKMAKEIDPGFDAEVLKAADPRGSIQRKSSPGSTGIEPLRAQIAWVKKQAAEAAKLAERIPTLGDLYEAVRAAKLE